jgi:hypothetical protein
MSTLVRWFLVVEAALLGSAALIHAGILISGYEHRAARTAETVIALVLFAGFVGTGIAPQSSRGIGLGAQAFALVGTCVAIFTIVIGVGPRTVLDLTIHAMMVLLLVTGLILVGRRHSTVQHDTP